MQLGLRYKPPYGPLELISLGFALIFGTAGLPHILVRFYTVPDAKTARHSVVWAMALIGSFYIMTTFLGFGAATIVGRDFNAKNGGTNMSGPLLAQALAGDIFFAFICAIAFATILAVVAVLSIFWRRFNTAGAVTGLAVGLLASIGLILIGPSLMAIDPPTVTGTARHLIQAKAWFPLENPGVLSIPLGFLGAFLGTILTSEPSSTHKFNELLMRSNTGLGAEKATALH